MQTIVHAYSFDISKPEDKAAYAELCGRLKGWPHQMKSHTGNGLNHGGYYSTGKTLDGQTIELESSFLFENQWNTAPIPGFSEKGYRVFDWAEDAYFFHNGGENLNRRTGYWLEQTAEMREIRRNMNKCGYCGKQEPAAKGYVFCPHCLDSPYLKAADLKLIRMRAIDEEWSKFPELTEAEQAYLMPLYRKAQLEGTTERGKARLAKIRADIEAKYLRETENARTEHDGFVWLCDHGLIALTENCIYYNHTRKFSFGWRSPVDEETKSAILDVISEFPYPYEIKCADGKTLAAV